MGELQRKRKRTDVSIIAKQEGLKLLGYNQHGTKETAKMNPSSGSQWTLKDVAKKYGVVKIAVSEWIKNSKSLLESAERRTNFKNRKRLNEGYYLHIEQALTTYINDVIFYLYPEPTFQENAVCESTKQMRDKMIAELEKKLPVLTEQAKKGRS